VRYSVLGFALCVASAASSVAASAQHRVDRSLDSLGDAAATAVVRYADRSVAAADGYHRIGPDFPGMGEHWLHPATLLTGRVSADQPTILIFATIAGKPTLLGVGFVATTDRDHPTRDLPGWPGAWHEHSGLLSDESGVAPGAGIEGDTHVWVLHVWTGLPNADGRFVPDNWALPFLRAGIATPDRVNADAARAVSLVSGGERYVRDVLTDANIRTASNSASVDFVIAEARGSVTKILAPHRVDGLLGPSQSDALAAAWRELNVSLEKVVGENVQRLLAPAHTAGNTHLHEGSP
jgi:hypothetical protein